MRYRTMRCWLVGVLLVVALGLAGCAQESANQEADVSADVQPIANSGLHTVTLDEDAASRLGITVGQVLGAKRTPATRAQVRAVVPVSAIIYDPDGRSWVYAMHGTWTFVRQAVAIDHVSGSQAFLTSGPPTNTPIVTAGAPELLGAEYGVGEE
jgi:hypothetical protein